MPQNNNYNASNFEENFNELNPIQKSATEWGKGSVILLAGPGSGKTKVLTIRIAKLINESKDKKFRILALTFTNKAANEMRTRVDSMVFDAGNRLFIGTFHSFCADVLRQHGSHIGVKGNFTITSDDNDRLDVLRDALKRNNIETELITAKSILNHVDGFKSQFIEPENCKTSISNSYTKEIIYNSYKAYEEELSLTNTLDFNSIIYYACKLFKKYPILAKQYQTIYTYWCIDEFQDTNHAQYQLLKFMAGVDFKNIFVVADEDQLIYQWNGASNKRIDDFKNDFNAEIIQMPTNYRCPAKIIDLANNLIKYNLSRQANKAIGIAAKKTNESPNEVIRLLNSQTFKSEIDEACGIANDIKQKHSHELANVLVLARNRKLLEGLKHELDSIEIKAEISLRRDEFISQPFIFFHNVLKLANNRNSQKSFQKLFQAFIEFTMIDLNYEEIIETVKLQGADYLAQWVNTALSKCKDDNINQLIKLVQNKLNQGRDYKSFVNEAIKLLEKIVDSSSPSMANNDTNNDISSKASENLSNYNVQNQFNSLNDFQEDKAAWCAIYQEIISNRGSNLTLEGFLHELDLQSKEAPNSTNCVTLMTIHAAKGKEADHVYIIGMAEGILPSFQSKKSGDNSLELEEERRNCYVALTRAKQTLTLSYANNYYGWPKQPSQFLTEMGLL